MAQNDQKTLTITVPCYNAQDYMEKCLTTLLTGAPRVEIIIIDDGSHDKTGQIADEWASRYPETIRVHHQENGGHGEGINQGLKHAILKWWIRMTGWMKPRCRRFWISWMRWKPPAGWT